MSLFKKLFGGPDFAKAQAALPANLPFELTPVEGRRAVEEWTRLRDLWLPQGSQPIVVGDANSVQVALENQEANDGPVAEILARASSLTPEGVLAQIRSKADEDYYNAPTPDAWPSQPPTPVEFTVHRDLLTLKPKDVVFIAKLPTTKAHEIPALLKFGGFNSCPPPESHVAMLRHWEERYGLEVFGVSSEVIECSVTRPPMTKEAALALAQEQYIYCPDIVHQGTESVTALAATLLHSHEWYFWWD